MVLISSLAVKSARKAEPKRLRRDCCLNQEEAAMPTVAQRIRVNVNTRNGGNVTRNIKEKGFYSQFTFNTKKLSSASAQASDRKCLVSILVEVMLSDEVSFVFL